MAENSLSIAFGASLKEDTVNGVSELAEVGLDAIMDDGILKDIPLLSTAISIYKIGNNIKDRYNIKKLMIFLNEINNGIANEEKRVEYQHKFQDNDKFRNQELEYILVLIDRYISYDKPKILAKLYLAYLENVIVWKAFCQYTQTIDMFMPGDIDTLLNDSDIVTHNHQIDSSIIRLASLGLLISKSEPPFIEVSGNNNILVNSMAITKAKIQEKTFCRTDFGNKLASILKE